MMKLQDEEHIDNTSKEDENLVSLDDDETGYVFPGKNGVRVKRGRRKKKKKSKLKIVVISVFSLLLIGVLSVIAFILIGRSSLIGNNGDFIKVPEINSIKKEDNDRTITYKGVKYKYNEDTTSILLLGIDKDIESSEEGVSGTGGQADFVVLAVTDINTGKTNIINIPRDTITDVKVFSPKGVHVETKKQQVCLSYAYGDGGIKSCENTLKSVSELFYGVNINSYMAIDMNAIEILNETVGGVELTSLETFGSFTEGEKVKLDASNVMNYVRYRDVEELDSSLSRTKRQKQYLEAFSKKAVQETKKNIMLPLDVYGEIADYMVTDINTSKVMFLVSNTVLKGIDTAGITVLQGEVKEGKDKKAEFYPNEDKLFETFLNAYYEKVD